MKQTAEVFTIMHRMGFIRSIKHWNENLVIVISSLLRNCRHLLHWYNFSISDSICTRSGIYCVHLWFGTQLTSLIMICSSLGKHGIIPVTMKQPWSLWINHSHRSSTIMTEKQNINSNKIASMRICMVGIHKLALTIFVILSLFDITFMIHYVSIR